MLSFAVEQIKGWKLISAALWGRVYGHFVLNANNSMLLSRLPDCWCFFRHWLAETEFLRDTNGKTNRIVTAEKTPPTELLLSLPSRKIYTQCPEDWVNVRLSALCLILVCVCVCVYHRDNPASVSAFSANAMKACWVNNESVTLVNRRHNIITHSTAE